MSYNLPKAGGKLAFSAAGLLLKSDIVPQGSYGSTPPTIGTTTNRIADICTEGITLGVYMGQAKLASGGANKVEQRNGTNAQALHVYNTYTDASNYERLEIKWDANVAYISANSAGTGSNRALIIDGGSQLRHTVNGSLEWIIDGSRSIVYSNELRPGNASQCNLGITNSRWATTYTDGIATDVETFTASDTLDAKNNVCLCDCSSGNVTINLPSASANKGIQFHIKKTDSTGNTLTVQPDGSETIDSNASHLISQQNECVTLACDGSNYFIIGKVSNGIL